jgi:hypothetical protein
MRFCHNAWCPSVCLARRDQTQGQRLVRLTGASGGVGLSPTLNITALFFVGAYKYVLVGSWGPLLDF